MMGQGLQREVSQQSKLLARFRFVMLASLLGLSLIIGCAPAPNKPPTATIESPQDGANLFRLEFMSKVVEFRGKGEDPEKKRITYSWDFGDGRGKSSERNPTYSYEKPGTYIVTLTVADIKGAKAETRVTINVHFARSVLELLWMLLNMPEVPGVPMRLQTEYWVSVDVIRGTIVNIVNEDLEIPDPQTSPVDFDRFVDDLISGEGAGVLSVGAAQLLEMMGLIANLPVDEITKLEEDARVRREVIKFMLCDLVSDKKPGITTPELHPCISISTGSRWVDYLGW